MTTTDLFKLVFAALMGALFVLTVQAMAWREAREEVCAHITMSHQNPADSLTALRMPHDYCQEQSE